MNIDWGTLALIAVVAAAAATTVVLLVSFALVGWSNRSGSRVNGPGSGGAPAGRTLAGTAVAVICLLAAGLIVCYSLYLIVA